MLTMLRNKGVTSEQLFIVGLFSIAFTAVSWLISKAAHEDTARADRWGIFVGEWAPTFIALGVALRVDEDRNPKDTK